MSDGEVVVSSRQQYIDLGGDPEEYWGKGVYIKRDANAYGKWIGVEQQLVRIREHPDLQKYYELEKSLREKIEVLKRELLETISTRIRMERA